MTGSKNTTCQSTKTLLIPSKAVCSDLVSRMTLEEKLAQLGSRWIYELSDKQRAAEYLQHGIGQITRIGGASNLAPAESAATANQIQKHVIEKTRLGIPAMVHEECCAGYMARDATVFPQIIGLASTWQPELAGKMAEVVRIQMRAVGAHQGLSPVLDVVQDPGGVGLRKPSGRMPIWSHVSASPTCMASRPRTGGKA